MDRREFLRTTGMTVLGTGLSALPFGWVLADDSPKRRVLCFTKSAGYEHSVIKRTGDKLSLAEQTLTDLAKPHNIEVVCTKDGGIFTPDNIKQFDAFYFYTTGDLTTAAGDKNPPMSAEGKQAFLDAIKGGKGFLGTHAATDTFHTMVAGKEGDRYKSFGEKVDPYVAMIGAEFIHHNSQQPAKMIVIDPNFPGFKGLQDSFTLAEEWYSLKDFQENLHVLLVQDTTGMKGTDYQRPPYPATWARAHGAGRVFYTSMGHREDVWANPIFQNILLGGLFYAVGNVHPDVTPNLSKAAPMASMLPAPPPPKPPK